MVKLYEVCNEPALTKEQEQALRKEADLFIEKWGLGNIMEQFSEVCNERYDQSKVGAWAVRRMLTYQCFRGIVGRGIC